MIKLLNASFTRLRKSKIFWILLIFSIGLAAIVVGSEYRNMKVYGDVIEVEQTILNYSTIVGIVIAIFTSIFLGVEYSDGALRNKISIGHKRTNIYLTNLVVVSAASLLSYLLFTIVGLCLGIPLFGGIVMPLANLLKLLGCIIMMILSYCSIFTFIAMLVSNKTITAIASIMLTFLFMMSALSCLNVLNAQEYVQSASMVNGEMQFEKVPNPKYPSETKRKVYQTLLDINPAGQGFELAGRIAPNIKILPIYSLGIMVLITSSGLFLFNKKELK